MNKKEREICKFKSDFKKSFSCWHPNLSNDDRISRGPGLKIGGENGIFQDLENQAAHPNQEFPGTRPRPALHSQGRGYSGFHMTGMIEWGKNQNPKKIPRPNFNTKKSHAEYPSHKNFQKALNDITPKKETLV